MGHGAEGKEGKKMRGLEDKKLRKSEFDGSDTCSLSQSPTFSPS
jgi:hypothetical protein